MSNLTRRQLLSADGLMALGGVASRLPVSAAEMTGTSGVRIFDVRNYDALGDGKVTFRSVVNAVELQSPVSVSN
jgi:hypothetical protein